MNIRKHGRAFEYKESYALSFSASGIEFFAKDGFICTLESDTCGKLGDAEIHYARFGVYCDDELILDERLVSAPKNLTVAGSGLHRYLILKLSESADSTMFIKDIKSNSKVEPEEEKFPAEKSLRMEFYGDSITCGYGVEGKLAPDEFYTTATENCTKAYAYRTAQLLGAECTLVSKSGAGIISGYDGEGKRNTANLIIPYFDKAGCSMASFNDGTMPGDIEWTDWKEPDIVVVNLGTNDVSYCFPAAGFNEDNISEDEKSYLLKFFKEVAENEQWTKISDSASQQDNADCGANTESVCTCNAEETGEKCTCGAEESGETCTCGAEESGEKCTCGADSKAEDDSIKIKDVLDSAAAQLKIQGLRCGHFYREYKGFLKKLREKYPNAAIISTLGIMNSELNTTVGRALSDAQEEGLGENVFFRAFDLYDVENDGIGTDYHPSDISQRKAAEGLAEFIKQTVLG